jgi:hypothetical protein
MSSIHIPPVVDSGYRATDAGFSGGTLVANRAWTAKKSGVLPA